MNTQNHKRPEGPPDIPMLKARLKRPKRAVVTAGMPYANGPLHIGHLAGAILPPDFHARWLGLLIGREQVLFISGNDDHGSTSELAALKAGIPIRQFIDTIHNQQVETLKKYSVGFDFFTGTSRPETFPTHQQTGQEFLSQLNHNGMLEKKVTKQWFDPKLGRFLQDRFVRGKCPNPHCENHEAFSDECEACGNKFNPDQLINPRSELSDGRPELRDSLHWWLDMGKVSELIKVWIQSKEKTWRTCVYNEVINTVLPSLTFANTHEASYKEIKETLPKHKSKYAPGKKVLLQFEDRQGLIEAENKLKDKAVSWEKNEGWAHRSITRDVSWGIALPEEFGPEAKGKTLYVWPDSLIAPISFSKVALKAKGKSADSWREFWCDPEAKVYQFLGQDNVYFYVLMQAALWIGTQADIHRLPIAGEYQLTDVFSCFHLMVDGDKMSKSKGNFYTCDQLLTEKGLNAEQVRYYIANMSLPEKPASFDFAHLEERNKFLAGPMNAAFEKPISACHSKFGGKIPEGVVSEKMLKETTKMVQNYFRFMERADYPTLIGMIENYARLINGLFAQHKPHDDRHPENERADALFNCFYVLKNLMIMLYPFVPATMDRLRISLKLGPEVFSVDELGIALPAGHAIGEQTEYFPALKTTDTAS